MPTVKLIAKFLVTSSKSLENCLPFGKDSSTMKLASLLAIIGLLLKECYCDKDDSYYIAGTGNPNVNSKMYWKDTDNIFQDLSQFSTLYVEFHHCSWTWMQQEEADNNVDENDYWYMGKIPPMGANVAFSLYGSLKGQTFSGCNKDSFISSFYTNSGFDAFSSAMYKAGVSGFSKYFYMSSSDGSSQSSQYLTAKCMGAMELDAILPTDLLFTHTPHRNAIHSK